MLDISSRIHRVCGMKKRLTGKEDVVHGKFQFRSSSTSDPDYHGVDGNYRLVDCSSAWIDDVLVYDDYPGEKFRAQMQILPNADKVKIWESLAEALEEIEAELSPLVEALIKEEAEAKRLADEAAKEELMRDLRGVISKL